MKKLLSLAIIIVFAINVINGQNKITITKIENADVVKIMNSSIQLSKSNSNYLTVRIWEIANEEGSAKNVVDVECCEVSHSLIVGISQQDEAPKQALFRIDEFYNPSFGWWVEETSVKKQFVIEHGGFNKRERVLFEVGLDSLVQLKFPN